MAERFTVGVGAGSLREHGAGWLQVPYGSPRGGFSVRGDVYREAAACGVTVTGVYVTAEGGFAGETWESTGVEYSVAVDSGLSPEAVDELVRAGGAVAEIPRALRQGVAVRRVGHV